MFIVDKLLMSPVTGVLWIMKELHKHVQQEQAQESDRLTAKLSELYMLLETKQLSEEDFDAQESAILDRLDEIQAKAEASAEQEQGDEAGDVDEDGTAIDGEAEDEEDGDDEDDKDVEDDDDDDDEVDEDDEASGPEARADGDDSDDIEAMLLAEIESRVKPTTPPPVSSGDGHPTG